MEPIPPQTPDTKRTNRASRPKVSPKPNIVYVIVKRDNTKQTWRLHNTCFFYHEKPEVARNSASTFALTHLPPTAIWSVVELHRLDYVGDNHWDVAI